MRICIPYNLMLHRSVACRIPMETLEAADSHRGEMKSMSTTMSTIKNFDDALDFLPRSESASLLSRLAAEVAVFWSGLRDGLAAQRTYDELSRRGIPHDLAVRKAFERHLA